MFECPWRGFRKHIHVKQSLFRVALIGVRTHAHYVIWPEADFQSRLEGTQGDQVRIGLPTKGPDQGLPVNSASMGCLIQAPSLCVNGFGHPDSYRGRISGCERLQDLSCRPFALNHRLARLGKRHPASRHGFSVMVSNCGAPETGLDESRSHNTPLRWASKKRFMPRVTVPLLRINADYWGSWTTWIRSWLIGPAWWPFSAKGASCS